MFKKIVVGLLAIVTGFSMVVYLQPKETLVTRSVAVTAPAPAVFDQVNTLRKWDAWSPWAKLDPNAKNFIRRTRSRNRRGIGPAMTRSAKAV